jgi:glucose 1-dehydrogenase
MGSGWCTALMSHSQVSAQEPNSLNGRVAVVTGGSSGIGLAIAGRLAADGATVVITARRQQPLEQAVAELSVAGRLVYGHPCDVGSSAEVDALVAYAIAEHGGVDILVNNAGHRSRAPFWEISDQAWDEVLATNLRGPFLCSRGVVRHWMSIGGKGRIVNIGSIGAERATPTQAHYAAAKGGLRMLTQTMAVELAPYGIPVNCVDPGAIATPMIADRLQNEADLAFYAAKIPWGSVGDPANVAAAVAFLASPEAQYITGAHLAVDGGWLAA